MFQENGNNAGVAAGSFSDWLRDTRASLRSGKQTVEVPCGTCKGCCRSSMFIHIGPTETQTQQRIPRGLLFPAPGLPKGHVLMGYSDKGQCPMLRDDECSIYPHRPYTCRAYDCRMFAATGVPVEEQAQPEIAQRVKEWVFSYSSEESREEHARLRKAAAFLLEKRDLLPPGALPSHPGPLAAVAVRVYELYEGMKGLPDTAKAQAIAEAVAE